MKVITLKGGLGNQLFQYAHGLQTKVIGQEDVVFNIAFFSNRSEKDTDRPFLLSKFNINSNLTYKNIPQTFFDKVKFKILHTLNPDHGYYQKEKYFEGVEDLIRIQFTLREPFSVEAKRVENQIRQNQSSAVSIHIRRGDYVNNRYANAHHGVASLEYYKTAVAEIYKKVPQPAFFIFSDDIEWAKKNMLLDHAVYVSTPAIMDYEELMLMSCCSHNIIANSTFSWWAAYLNTNPGKIVIAPKQWTAHKTATRLNNLPKTWIQK